MQKRNNPISHSQSSNQTPLILERKKRGWTQMYVAGQMGVSASTVRRWESGKLPYPNSIQKLCSLFALSPKELGLIKDLETTLSPDAWKSDDREKQAAWEIYIELVTRVPLAPFEENQGILREALSSLYSLFQATRAVLRQLGPDKLRPDREYTLSLPYLGVQMLNTTLRPLLSKWHPLLKDYESKRPLSMGEVEYERQWEKYTDLRSEIVAQRSVLLGYANTFARIACTPLLISDSQIK